MENALNITLNDSHNLVLSGRLDSFGAQTLDQELATSLRQGNYALLLDLSNVHYVSSAGIRTLLKYNKQFRSLGGQLRIIALSQNAREVFGLAGITDLLVETEDTPEASKGINQISSEKALFECMPLAKGSLKLRIHGKPFAATDSYTAGGSQLETFSADKYALGLGALGEDFEACKHQFGEYMAVGDLALYMPTDGSKSADYIQRIEKLIPKVVSLNSLIFEGKFSTLARFTTKDQEQSVGLSEITDCLFKQTRAEAMAMVMIAETSGLVGCSLNTSPAIEHDLAQTFKFPLIRETLDITTEPEYDGCLSLVCGIVHRNLEVLTPFSRPMEGSNLETHFHASVFSFQPIQKNSTDLGSAVESLIEGSKLHNVLHLLNDDRPHEGIGESSFVKGSCWFGPIEEIIKE